MESKKFYSGVKTIVICIGLNLIGDMIGKSLSLPIWFNMVGTILAVINLGFSGGMIVTVSSILLALLWNPSSIYYLPVALTCVVLSLYIRGKGRYEVPIKALISGFWVGALCALVATIFSLLLQNGYSGNRMGDILVDMLLWKKWPKTVAGFLGQVVVEVMDKQVVTMLAVAIYYGWKNKKKGFGKKNVTKVVSSILFLCLLFTTDAWSVDAAENAGEEQYTEKIYDNTNGLLSSSVNVIGETSEGAIWLGGYSGVTVFDGNDFHFLSDSGIASAICMQTDEAGRMWIGTNDSGVAIYDHGTIRFVDKKSGLPSQSVKSMKVDSTGNMYVGTTSQLCRITSEYEVQLISDEQIYIKKVEIINDVILVIDNSGKLYKVENDQLILWSQLDEFFTCMEGNDKELLIGTESGKIYSFELNGNEIDYKRTLFSAEVSIDALHRDRNGNVWIAMKQGVGYLDGKYKLHEMHFANFDSNFENIHEDYQGNIWIASSNCGVLKLSKSKFTNLFTQAEIENEMVNAVIEYNGDLYCGTDTGLRILNEKSGEVKENGLTRLVEGSRVRSFLKDHAGRLWVCTYGNSGLICYKNDNKMSQYTVEEKGCTSNRFRCLLELDDGTIVAGTADGINLIKNDSLVRTITSEDGLENTQILSLAKGRNGAFYAATDGAGIYEISDGKIINHFDSDNGMSADIILRMIPVQDGLLVASGKELNYINSDNEIKCLNNFPYYNNYDILLQDDLAYVTGSAGIYAIKIEDLLANKVSDCRLYGANDGLIAGLSSNSWNMQGEDKSMYLCSNMGVIKFIPSKYESDIPIKVDVNSVLCDGKKIDVIGNQITIPQGIHDADFELEIHNYSLNEMKVVIYMDDHVDDAREYGWNEVPMISLSNLSAGNHVFHVRVLNSTGENELLSEEFYITKSRQPWEEWPFRIYLWLVVAEILGFGIFSIIVYYLSEKRKEDLEKMHDEQTKIIAEQTEAIRLEQKKTENLLFQTVIALSGAVDAKDKYTSGHSTRVAEYSRMLAKAMGKSEEEQEQIYRAGLLHDVGKIRIPEDIINKTGALTDEEYEIIKIHPITGYNILKKIAGNTGSIAIGAKYHHEKYDGSGYPNGLSGENIPEIARIIGVADAYDAMASNRSYRKALDQSIVRAEIEKGKGTQFDPYMADLWLQLMDKDTEYSMREMDDSQKDILVVDDEMMNISVIKKILKQEPYYNISVAYSGAEAVEFLKEHVVDIILLDLMMPEMDGFETLEQIRKITDVPVIFMTGDRNIENITRASEMGVDDYITKPFLPLAFKEILHSVLK